MHGKAIEQVSYSITIESQRKSLCCDGRDTMVYRAYALLKLYWVFSCCDLSNAHYHKYYFEALLQNKILDIYLLINVVNSKLSISTLPESCPVYWTVPKLECSYSARCIFCVARSVSSGSTAAFTVKTHHSKLMLRIFRFGAASKYPRLLAHELLTNL